MGFFTQNRNSSSASFEKDRTEAMHSVPTNLRGIAETLFLPLYFRAIETQRSDALFKDFRSVELVSKIAYDFSKLAGYDLLQTTVALRVREFDRCVQDFIKKNPQATVVNLGCGLDTRFHRLDNGLIQWYECDLPQVIALRKLFFESSLRYHHFPSSIVDDENWLYSIHPSVEKGLLFLAEGLFPYFHEAQLDSIILALKKRFPGAVLMFDAVSPLQAELSRYHPALSIMGANFKWGMRHARSFENRDNGIRLLWQVYYFDRMEPRLGWYNMLSFFPFVRYGFSVVAYRFV
jgi:O-methyltransferase involved in polyketide biosynthesis